jgi:hypothetical protein
MNLVGMRQWMSASCLAAVTAVFLAGCGGGGDAAHNGQEAGGQSTAKAGGESDIAANLALLSEEDRALAEKQKKCPISEDPLGEMGKPYKLVLNGETVFLCCSSCKDKAEADPEATLAKVAEFVAANGAAGGE